MDSCQWKLKFQSIADYSNIKSKNNPKAIVWQIFREWYPKQVLYLVKVNTNGKLETRTKGIVDKCSDLTCTKKYALSMLRACYHSSWTYFNACSWSLAMSDLLFSESFRTWSSTTQRSQLKKRMNMFTGIQKSCYNLHITWTDDFPLRYYTVL